MVKIVLASTSKIKSDAVQNCFERLVREDVTLDGDDPLVVDVRHRSVPSGVSDQPVGLETTVRGAQNRLQNARMAGGSDQDYYVAMENGVVKLDADNHVDLAVVIIEDGNGKRGMATSCGVQVPSKIVYRLRRGQTIGDAIAATTGCNAKDPHIELTGGFVNRQTLLENALYAAYGCMERLR